MNDDDDARFEAENEGADGWAAVAVVAIVVALQIANMIAC